MLHRPTTFVIGAGASRDFGFPVGGELAERIASGFNLNFEYSRLTSGSIKVYEAIKRAIEGISNQSAFDLCHQIRKGLVHYDSIDDYVEAASDENVSVAAKIAISEVIGLAERKSALAHLGSHENSKLIAGLRGSWPAQLLRLALRGVKHSDISSLFESISIISFNYDRALEHYLYWALRDLGFADDLVIEAMNSLEVLHPYGTLGYLPWQEGISVPFGAPNVELEKVYGSIRTYSEQLDDKNQIYKISNAISNAETVVFLGFGFHKQNVDLLSGPILEPKEVFATACGVSSSQRRAFEARIRRSISPDATIRMDDATCDKFFAQHGQEIAL
ncbi:hypothetical protein D3C85_1012290 [compost metagenome]